MRFGNPTTPTTPTVSPVVTMRRVVSNALDVPCPACGSQPGERCHLRMPGWPGGGPAYHVLYQDTPHKDRLRLAELRGR